MKSDRIIYRGAGGPFDDCAQFRLQRMGLLDGDGVPDQDALTVMAVVFSGLLFDDLCDFFQSYEEVQTAVCRMMENAAGADAKHKFLLICLQYDSIYQPLPDPIWWISGNEKLTSLFSEQYFNHLKLLVERQEGGEGYCVVS